VGFLVSKQVIIADTGLENGHFFYGLRDDVTGIYRSMVSGIKIFLMVVLA